MSTLISYLLCVRYFVRLRGSRGDLKVCIFQRLHSNLLQVRDVGSLRTRIMKDCRSRESGIGVCVCVCVKNGKLREQHTELLWGATSYFLLLHPHGHEDEGKDTDVVVTTLQEARLLVSKGLGMACSYMFSFKVSCTSTCLQPQTARKVTQVGKRVNSFLHRFKNNAYKDLCFPGKYGICYMPHIRFGEGTRRK